MGVKPGIKEPASERMGQEMEDDQHEPGAAEDGVQGAEMLQLELPVRRWRPEAQGTAMVSCGEQDNRPSTGLVDYSTGEDYSMEKGEGCGSVRDMK